MRKKFDWFPLKAVLISITIQLLVWGFTFGFKTLFELEPKILALIIGGSAFLTLAMDRVVVTVNKHSEEIEQLAESSRAKKDKKLDKLQTEEKIVRKYINGGVKDKDVPRISRELKPGEEPTQYQLQQEKTIQALGEAFRK